MKRLGSILLVAGCLSGTLQPYAQEYPAGPLYDTPDELSFKARAAARTLLFKELEPLSLQWLREEVNPLLRARRKLRQAMQTRAEKAAATAADAAYVTTTLSVTQSALAAMAISVVQTQTMIMQYHAFE